MTSTPSLMLVRRSRLVCATSDLAPMAEFTVTRMGARLYVYEQALLHGVARRPSRRGRRAISQQARCYNTHSHVHCGDLDLAPKSASTVELADERDVQLGDGAYLWYGAEAACPIPYHEFGRFVCLELFRVYVWRRDRSFTVARPISAARILARGDRVPRPLLATSTCALCVGGRP